jgi:hypothetical protein
MRQALCRLKFLDHLVVSARAQELIGKIVFHARRAQVISCGQRLIGNQIADCECQPKGRFSLGNRVLQSKEQVQMKTPILWHAGEIL